MIPLRPIALLALCAALALPSSAWAAGASAGGFVEVRFAASPGADGQWWQLVERFRPRFEVEIVPRVSIYTEVEFAMAQGRNPTLELQRTLDESDFGPLLDAAGWQWPTKKNTFLQIDDIRDVLFVERLYVDVYLPGVDIRVGRQALFWGSALMLNPTDPFPQLLIAEPWRPRQGTNAIRATVPLSKGKHDFTAVLAANDSFTAIRAAARLRLRLSFADLAIVAAFRGDDIDGLIGVDLRGNLGVGYWLEAALHIDDTVHEEIAIGIDYSFPVLQSFVVALQYYRNGAGAGPKDEPTATNSALGGSLDLADSPLGAAFGASDNAPQPETFAPLLGGRDYLLLSVSLGIVNEVSASLFTLQNLSDGTGFIVPTVNVIPTGWLSLSLSAQIQYRLWGDGGEFKPDKDDLILTADAGPLGELTADLSGLLPAANVTLWTRINF